MKKTLTDMAGTPFFEKRRILAGIELKMAIRCGSSLSPPSEI
jgi:hypothetical protein